MTTTSSRRRKAFGYSAIGLMAAGFGGSVMAPIASAADSTPTPTGTTTTGDNGKGMPPSYIGLMTDPLGDATFFGTFKPNGYSDQVICIDAGLARPITGKTTPTTVSNYPETAYLVSKYSQTTDDLTAGALVYIVKKAMDSNQSVVDAAYDNVSDAGSGTTKAAFDAKVAALKAEAAANAGPYSASLAFNPASAKVGDTVKLGGVGVKGKSGNYISGFSTTVTLSGPATFADGSKTKTVTSSTAAQSLDVKITGAGDVSASESVSVPNNELSVYAAPGEGIQRMLEYVNAGKETFTASAKLTAAPETTTTTTQVKTTTQAQGQNANKGSKISDKISVEGPAGAHVVGKNTLYKVPAGTKPTADNVTAVQTWDWNVTLDSNGKGSVNTPEYTVPEDGFDYHFLETTNAGSIKDTAGNVQNWPATSGTLGDTAESVLYQKPKDTTSTVTVSTQAQGQNANKGSVIYDKIFGTAPAGAKITGKNTLYSVPAGTPKTLANATKVMDYTWNATAGADGKYEARTPDFTSNTDGRDYFFVESVDAGSMANPDGSKVTWPAASGTVGDTAETVLYVKPADTVAHATIATQAQGQNANKGSKISDKIFGTAPAGAKLSGKDVLYRVKAGQARTPENAQKVTEYDWNATADATGKFAAQTPEYVVPENGYDYFYAESLNAGSIDNPNGSKTTWNSVTGKFGDSTETVLYVKPGDKEVKVTLSTQAQGKNANKGSVIYDRIFGEAPAGAKVSGKDTLYRVPVGKDMKIENAEKVKEFDWSATAGADGKYEARTADYTIPEDGYNYVFVESVNAGSVPGGDGDFNITWPGASGVFGNTAETVLYEKPADKQGKVTITTQAQGANANKGSKISDKIFGEAPVGAKLSGTDVLYRVKAGQPRTKANAEKVQDYTWSATAGADGKYSAQTPEYTIPEDGYDYFYFETVNGGSIENPDGSKTTWNTTSGSFGDSSETVLFNKPVEKPKQPTPEKPQPQKPVEGPKVQTDYTGASSSSIALDAMAAAAVAGIAGAGIVVRRRRQNG